MKKGMGINKENKNKGFSLVELVVAIAMLAIVLTPVMSTFITSVRMNNKARTLMAANDVGQAVIESFSNKKYEGIKKIVKMMAESDASSTPMDLDGKNAFSNINNDVYNKGAHRYKVETSSVAVSSPASSVVAGSFNVKEFSRVYLAQAILRQYLLSSSAGNNNLFTYYIDDNDLVMGMTYTDVTIDGCTFDVVVTIVPCATVDTAEYFPCKVTVSVYDSAKKSHSAVHATEVLNGAEKPLYTIETGIMNR